MKDSKTNFAFNRSDEANGANAKFGLSDLFTITVNGQAEHVIAIMNRVLPYVLEKHLAREVARGRSAEEVQVELQMELDSACAKAGLRKVPVFLVQQHSDESSN